jgi:hypothetical protein
MILYTQKSKEILNLVIFSIRLNSTTESMTVGCSIFEIFFTCISRRILYPSLQKGDVAVMGNLSCHKSEKIEQAINDCKAKLYFLPTYSSYFYPIGKKWSHYSFENRISAKEL